MSWYLCFRDFPPAVAQLSFLSEMYVILLMIAHVLLLVQEAPVLIHARSAMPFIDITMQAS